MMTTRSLSRYLISASPNSRPELHGLSIRSHKVARSGLCIAGTAYRGSNDTSAIVAPSRRLALALLRLERKVRRIRSRLNLRFQFRVAVVSGRDNLFRRHHCRLVRIRFFAGGTQSTNLDAKRAGAETV